MKYLVRREDEKDLDAAEIDAYDIHHAAELWAKNDATWIGNEYQAFVIVWDGNERRKIHVEGIMVRACISREVKR